MAAGETMIKTIAFGGGCFWCTEAVFKMLKGVSSVLPGYSGGQSANPTYEQISTGSTGHVEVAKVDYDPSLVSFRDLLTVFFSSHDPTTLDRQGDDIGSQYRSVIFYEDPEQKREIEKFIAELNAANEHGAPIITQIEQLGKFYPAEDYHRDYYAQNSDKPYCQIVINPKLAKLRGKFAKLLKG